jgi:hypothetical protein
MDTTDGLEGTWELAETEELLGDALFFGGETGAVVHYRAAQRALMPLGVALSSREENDRRMEAFQRVSTKLYAIGADGKAGSTQDCQAHPHYVAAERKVETEPISEVPAVLPPSVPKPRLESELGRLLSTGDWWADYRHGASWFEVGKSLAAGYPVESRAACEWSLEHFEKYARAWTKGMPASRWDPDGSSEMAGVKDFKNALSGETAVAAPGWVGLLLAGDWRESLAAFERDATVEGFQSMGEILAEACKADGLQGAARLITETISAP